MRIEYVGERSRYSNGKQRGAECFGNPFLEKEQENQEQLKMDYVAKRLKERGWEVTEGVPLWFHIKLEDREEYDELLADYKKIKKELGRMKND